MGSNTYSDDFKRDAVAQITERGYPVREVSDRLGVSAYSLYAWKKKFAKAASGDASSDAEILRLKRELARVTEERDILKKATAYFARDAELICSHHPAGPLCSLAMQPEKDICPAWLCGDRIVQRGNLHTLKALLPM